MRWRVEFRDAHALWERDTDPDHDADLRIAVLEFLHAWQIDGPPEADYDDSRPGAYETDIPGTRVSVRFILTPSAPETIQMLSLRG